MTKGIGTLRVAVLLGGPSAERDISLKSGAAVAGALRESGHSVIEIDPAATDLTKHNWSGIDAAFIALHGKFGEDGQVQQILEDAGVAYTGSGVQASRLAISKSASKERFLQHHVPTAPYVLIHETDTAHRILQEASHLGFPIVVKPDTQGSSLGVSFVHSPDQLPAALTRCFHYDSFGVLERLVSGTEWTVGLVDDDLLPLIKIETDRPFFDFDAKYQDDSTRYVFDAEAGQEASESIAQAARGACAALGTRGLARVDLILDKFNRPWVLEINTVPGLTDHSLVPKAAARRGWSYSELCERCLESALAVPRNPALRIAS